MIPPVEHEVAHATADRVALCREVEFAARDRLEQCGYASLRTIDCIYTNGVLTLRGSVPSFYLKQVAQVAVKDLPHVHQLDNRLVVTPP